MHIEPKLTNRLGLCGCGCSSILIVSLIHKLAVVAFSRAQLPVSCYLKLRVPGPTAQYTLVYGAAPVRSGVRYVHHFPFLGLLLPPKDGWSDITELYVARYGVPKLGTAIWIRTCQHIDGWIDVPKVVRARVLALAA